MFRCRIERHSANAHKPTSQLVSFVVEFPRVVLAETVTHRVNSDSWAFEEISFASRTTTPDVSKNSASSRAIPFARMIERVQYDPYMPQWTANQRGMQGDAMQDKMTVHYANNEWLSARDDVLARARKLHDMGVHKQDVNRLLEPWGWITQIITATVGQLQNFFALRCHKAAHPAFQRIARMMFLCLRQSVPEKLDFGQWHLPFVPLETQRELSYLPPMPHILAGHELDLPDLIKHSAARCAWLSYENHDKDGTPEAMLSTWGRLVGDTPKHASPVEHQATPLHHTWDNVPRLKSNFAGWLQARKLLAGERTEVFDPSPEEIESWGMGGGAVTEWPPLPTTDAEHVEEAIRRKQMKDGRLLPNECTMGVKP